MGQREWRMVAVGIEKAQPFLAHVTAADECQQAEQQRCGQRMQRAAPNPGLAGEWRQRGEVERFPGVRHGALREFAGHRRRLIEAGIGVELEDVHEFRTERRVSRFKHARDPQQRRPDEERDVCRDGERRQREQHQSDASAKAQVPGEVKQDVRHHQQRDGDHQPHHGPQQQEQRPLARMQRARFAKRVENRGPGWFDGSHGCHSGKSPPAAGKPLDPQ